jgi:predicted O-linked N-acetylglucosamine transferase (SPINDLY family)
MLVLEKNTLLNSYWQEGVDYVLCGRSDDAQAVWLAPFFDNELNDSSIDEDEISQSLVNYLLNVIINKEQADEITAAYELSQHLCAVAPGNANILLIFLNLSVKANQFSPEIFDDYSFVEVFNQASPQEIDLVALNKFITNAIGLLAKQDNISYIHFLKVVTAKVSGAKELIQSLYAQADRLGGYYKYFYAKNEILKICLEYSPAEMKINILSDLTDINITSRHSTEAIAIAKQCYQEGKMLGGEKHLFSSHQLLHAYMESGDWQMIPAIAHQHQQIIQEFVMQNQDKDISIDNILVAFFLNYLYDKPQFSHFLRNSIGRMCSKTINLAEKTIGLNKDHSPIPKTSKIRIGYIGSNLYKHSVGWLSRWIFDHHDHSEFEVYIYHVQQLKDDSFNHKYFRDKADRAYYLYGSAEEIADLISKDKIDILIDLDSVDFTVTYNVLCYKPAPVSATWLGWDASGCPEVDYFIADPYVLPIDAEEYYHSKIWRLPQTYLAIDGFEVEVPTKRRSDYNLSKDAIVFLCAQKSYKHHPDILRLQMQIIKKVPNSYLMVQLRANPESLMRIYQELAAEVGISMEQLRFINLDPDEMTHRANLQLADVVLDTFPYNGATTTLETLWMGVPMVTKVGQAFVARNSYTFMQNVGVTEGIAHTDAEYVDWGVRLGTDSELRQQVMGKLLHSRKTSPLWNARSFTREMENAYRQMWEVYQSKQK